jgi:hypothetical protein
MSTCLMESSKPTNKYTHPFLCQFFFQSSILTWRLFLGRVHWSLTTQKKLVMARFESGSPEQQSVINITNYINLVEEWDSIVSLKFKKHFHILPIP